MPQTDRIEVVTQAIVDLLKANNASLQNVLDGDIYYGDQQKYPRTPAIGVESGSLIRELDGRGGKGVTLNTFQVFCLCYISKVQSVQVSRKEADDFAGDVADVLHSDITLGGLVIHGYVTRIEPGFSIRGGELMRAARVTWQGISKTIIV